MADSSGWRIDRRTFLKALGLVGAGLVAGTGIGAWPRTTWAAEAPALGPIDELALALEFDRERIFRFVTEQIRYEPYSGVLRGAEGALMARAGNSADQAVLLAALLRASGIDCRFAQGPIDATTGDVLLSSAIVDLETAQDRMIEALAGTAEGGRPIVIPGPDAETRARADEAMAKPEQVVAWAAGQLDKTASMIEAALSEAAVTLPTGFSPLPALEREGHLWVQAILGPTWIDLDPSLPNALPGESSANHPSSHEEVPAEIRHRLTFRVLGETVRGGGLHQETLLEASEFADVLALRPIGLVNIEQEGLKALGAGIVSALEGGTTYLPCLMMGDDVVVGPGAIRFGGDTANEPFALAEPSPGRLLEGEPTAEWLEITITSPGAIPVTVSRPVFDRVGPAVRAAGKFEKEALAPAELVQLDATSPPDYLPAQTTHWLTVHTGPVGGKELGEQLEPARGVAVLPAAVQAYHVARELAAAAVALPDGTRTFVDAPNVVSLTIEQDHGAAEGHVMRPSFDIWHRSLGTLPVAGHEPRHAPAMTAGIIPHVAERVLVGDPLRDGTSDAGIFASVGAVFDAARLEGVRAMALWDPAQLAGLPYPQDAMARLRTQLDAGYVAVAPERPVMLAGRERVGWWLVDPSTGRTFDELDGRGIAMPEYVRITIWDETVVIPLRRIADCIVVGAIAATFLLWVKVGLNVIQQRDDRAGLGAAIVVLASGGGAAATHPLILGGFKCGI